MSCGHRRPLAFRRLTAILVPFSEDAIALGDRLQLENLILRLQSLGVNEANVEVVWGCAGMGDNHRPIWQHQGKGLEIFSR